MYDIYRMKYPYKRKCQIHTYIEFVKKITVHHPIKQFWNLFTYIIINLLIYDISTFLFCHYRCSDVGKYAMSGSQVRKCVGGSWDGVKPTCFGLNQENDYASKYTILLV